MSDMVVPDMVMVRVSRLQLKQLRKKQFESLLGIQLPPKSAIHPTMKDRMDETIRMAEQSALQHSSSCSRTLLDHEKRLKVLEDNERTRMAPRKDNNPAVLSKRTLEDASLLESTSKKRRLSVSSTDTIELGDSPYSPSVNIDDTLSINQETMVHLLAIKSRLKNLQGRLQEPTVYQDTMARILDLETRLADCITHYKRYNMASMFIIIRDTTNEIELLDSETANLEKILN
ncbi:hypothetical protein BC833DRAFT_626493 [Globomyces pollinis-pini]|nr:hypothetical protein BC833DRAFT_626493 [Globomyces pollinis-pini]